jgi:hypothetical protein
VRVWGIAVRTYLCLRCGFAYMRRHKLEQCIKSHPKQEQIAACIMMNLISLIMYAISMCEEIQLYVSMRKGQPESRSSTETVFFFFFAAGIETYASLTNQTSDVSSIDPARSGCTSLLSLILFQPNPTTFSFSITNDSAVAKGANVENGVEFLP